MGLNSSSCKYDLECACGNIATVTAEDVEEHGLITWRHRCKQCGQVTYYNARSKSTRVHQKTLDLQFYIHAVFAEIGPPMTVRQVFYQLEKRKVVEKSDKGYGRVQTQLAKMRRAGSIPYGWVSDNSRSYLQERTHESLQDAMQDMAQWYRRNLWAEQDVHVEVWLEKRALISQLWPICQEFGIKLFPSGGFSSISFAYEAAMDLKRIDKPIYIYHLADFDADGAYISVALENELRTHGIDFTFRRLLLNQEQIEEHGLHSALRPQKRSSPRFNWWAEQYGQQQQACEMDALDPRILRQLVHNAIQSHIDPWSWERLKAVEEEEREDIKAFIKAWHTNGT